MDRNIVLKELLEDRLEDALVGCSIEHRQVTAEIQAEQWADAARILRDKSKFDKSIIQRCRK